MSGPYSFAPGSYEVEISESNTLAPCTNPTIASLEVTLSAGETVTAVAQLSGGAPTLAQFGDDFLPVTAGDARFVFRQTAEAKLLTATLTQLGVSAPKTYSVTAGAGEQQAIQVPAGAYLVQVFFSGGSTVLVSKTIVIDDQSGAFTYAAGRSANGSIDLVYRIVDGLY